VWTAARIWNSILSSVLLVLLLPGCVLLLPQETASWREAAGDESLIGYGPLPTRAMTTSPARLPSPTETTTPQAPLPAAPSPTAAPTSIPTPTVPSTPAPPAPATVRVKAPGATLSPVRMAETEILTFLKAPLSPIPAPMQAISAILPIPAPPPAPLIIQSEPGENGYPTLADFWDGRAEFALDVADTGLPMGESDTMMMHNGELWSYVHASIRSAGAVDRCGDPVPFPGCTVIYRSSDGGMTFSHEVPLVCQFECATCPCVSEVDHVEQQQYPRVAYNGASFFLVYEYLGRTRLRRSTDGLTWSAPERVADTGIWKLWLRTCRKEERIHPHPFVTYEYECLSGAPPGIFVEGGRLYIFVGLGQNPGGMGCYTGSVTAQGEQFTRCRHNPLFVGAGEYGPLEEKGAQTNPYFDFRTISSAEVQRIGARVYMLYEGVRGPGPGDAGDSQFGLGLARSLTSAIDGPWEKYPGNPILVDQPGNVGLGHADLVVIEGQTFLYTSLNGYTRSRLVLGWR
jgi:hypothetical protein